MPINKENLASALFKVIGSMKDEGKDSQIFQLQLENKSILVTVVIFDEITSGDSNEHAG